MPASSKHDDGVSVSLERVDDTWEVSVEAGGAPALGAGLRLALARVADEGGGPVSWWAEAATDVHDEAAAAAELEPTRTLLQLRRPLPTDEPATLEVRGFEIGRDEDAWLEVNNRAFAWHPEQSDWDPHRLRAAMAEPWFDPAGFLLHEIDGRLTGFCWTKVHDEPEHLGEIFVIGVDPDFTGRGLGRALTLAGLDHLWSVRGTPTGMLYVEADNDRALAMYDHLGFTTHHVNKRYEGRVEAPGDN